ncbi:hypothetical protein SAMN05216350_101546 [Polaromonas sp. YR568]|uniref:hypothetical protein n=1 Tax=Polaromonas sp. YR568 TaxID=1855301 RepID=UPI0008E67E2E|nr:hypothetical protein [Polaromonas sp. YR568]SFU36580.1 hypothetical protein SAMN05216350_101546 [Polaromonas sp. YR568]
MSTLPRPAHITRRAVGLALASASFIGASYAQSPSPSPSQESVAGDYMLQGVMETGSGLRLSTDGSYRFFLMVGSVDEIDQGRWYIENSNVVLESTAPPQVPTFTFLRSSREPGGAAKVSFEGPDAEKVPGLAQVDFTVNGLAVPARRARSASLEAEIFDVPISKVSLFYLGVMRNYAVVVHRPQDPSHNHFVFGAVLGNYGFVRFDKQSLAIDGDRLRMKPPGMAFGPDREFRYAKVKPKSP